MRNKRNGAAKPELGPIRLLKPAQFIVIALLVALTACKAKPRFDLALEEHRLYETVPEFLEREHWPTAMDDCRTPAHVIPKTFRESPYGSLDLYCAEFQKAITGSFTSTFVGTTDGNKLKLTFKEGKLTCVEEHYPNTSYADMRARLVKQYGPPTQVYEQAGKEWVVWWNPPINKTERGVLELHPGLVNPDVMARLHLGKVNDSCL